MKSRKAAKPEMKPTGSNNCRIVGIVNATPDSFSDGGCYDPVKHALALAAAGADWLDLGGESTRPGSACIHEAEEIRRVVPAIAALHAALPAMTLCVDTRKAAVAGAALAAGAAVVNDVSGLVYDPELAAVAAEHRAVLVLTHSRGTPEHMLDADHTDYGSAGVIAAVLEFWECQTRAARAAGVAPENIWVDPGFGFAKTAEQNWEMADGFERFLTQPYPVYVGVSRKRFLGGSDPMARVEAGTRVAVNLARRGARAVRTHDVAEFRRAAGRQ